MLIAIPLKMLWNVTLPYNLRPVVPSIFAASVFTTLASILYVVFLTGARGWGPGLGVLVAVTSHLEVCPRACLILSERSDFASLGNNGVNCLQPSRPCDALLSSLSERPGYRVLLPLIALATVLS